jgi:hypothetical protein
MKTIGLLMLMAGLALSTLAAELDVGPQLVPGENDAAWRPLFAELGARRSILSMFTEHRWFPFRKVPVVLKGEMRMLPDQGVSLHYTEPEERTVVMDTRGLLIREAGGRQKEVPSDPRVPAASTALLPILRFDWEKLERVFVVHAARDGERWRLDFVPRDPQLAGTIGRIIARGGGLSLEHLEFRRSAMQRVEILIGETRPGVEFTAEEKQRYFR